MLRLERARSREINIAIRQRDILVNRTFLAAFGIAVSLHLFAFLLFKVHSLLIIDENALLSTFVESDLSIVTDDVLAYIEEEGDPKKFFFQPAMTAFSNLILPKPTIIKHKDQWNDSLSQHNPFSAIEEDKFPFFSEQPVVSKPIQIHVSGHLSEISLLDDGTKDLESLLVPKKWSEDGYVVSFEVEAESDSGKIFWYSQRGIANIPHLNRLAEKVIKNMIFQKSGVFVTKGFVEVMFRKPAL